MIIELLLMSFCSDLVRQLRRRGVPYQTLDIPVKKTVTAMRLLAAISDNKARANLSTALYRVNNYILSN